MSWSPLWLSLEIATLAMIAATLAGTALALVLDWHRLPAPHLADAIISAPLVLPPTVLGYYLLVLLGHHSWLGGAWEAVTGGPLVFTFAGAVVAGTVGSLPLVVRAVRVGLDAVDPALVAAARTLGATPWRVRWTITLPLAAPGIAAGAMLGFARALGDYGITQMVAGRQIDGVPTASIFVMDAYDAGHDAEARAMAIATTIVGVVLLWLANRLTRRVRRG
jgi:molybdate transport system permease protein